MADQQAQPAKPAPQPASGSGMDPKMAITLSWCPFIGWIAAIIFIATEKENYRIKFHAWQALFFGIASMVIGTVIGWIPVIGWCIVPIVLLVAPIVVIVKAWNGEDMELPLIGEWAKQQANK